MSLVWRAPGSLCSLLSLPSLLVSPFSPSARRESPWQPGRVVAVNFLHALSPARLIEVVLSSMAPTGALAALTAP